jgi:hypothetical protein
MICHPERRICCREARASTQSKDPCAPPRTHGVMDFGWRSASSAAIRIRLEVGALPPEVRALSPLHSANIPQRADYLL